MTACVGGTLRDVGAGSETNGRGGSRARTTSRAADLPATDAKPHLPPSTSRPPGAIPQRRAVPTMRDIAARPRVSQSTVSRVLNDAPTRVPIAAGDPRAGDRSPPAGSATGPTRSPAACAARRRCCSAPSSATSPTRSSPGAIEALSIEAMAPRLQRRPRPRPRPGGRGARPDGGPRDAPLRRDRPARRHAGPAAAARGPRGLRSSPSSRCGRARARSRCRPSTSTTAPASGPGSTTSSGLGHERIAFVSGRPPRRHPRARGGVHRVHDRALRRRPRRLRPPGPEHAGRRRERARARCSRCRSRRPRS